MIREWRERRNLTQRELAGRSGLHLASIGAYERGERNPQMDALARICFALDVEPSAFCLDVARAEAHRLAPLVDELKRQAGQDITKRTRQAGQVEELRWASDLVFNKLRDIFVTVVRDHFEESQAEPEASPASQNEALNLSREFRR